MQPIKKFKKNKNKEYTGMETKYHSQEEEQKPTCVLKKHMFEKHNFQNFLIRGIQVGKGDPLLYIRLCTRSI